MNMSLLNVLLVGLVNTIVSQQQDGGPLALLVLLVLLVMLVVWIVDKVTKAEVKIFIHWK